MHHCQLPLELRQSVRRYGQYKWVATRGVDERTPVRSSSRYQTSSLLWWWISWLPEVGQVVVTKMMVVFGGGGG
ncbi:hypothetical protein HanIR_Chr12g0614631 [Helianthus annuus]|nr:hypothetical protein HanIR_Chr12g0614631 [Helianthus annuus]